MPAATYKTGTEIPVTDGQTIVVFRYQDGRVGFQIVSDDAPFLISDVKTDEHGMNVTVTPLGAKTRSGVVW